MVGLRNRQLWITAVLIIAVMLAVVTAVAQSTTIRAALTRDVDNPDRQEIFRHAGELIMSAGESTVDECVAAPPGKRIVVEHVNLYYALPLDQTPSPYLFVGMTHVAKPAPTLMGFTDATHTRNLWVFNSPMKLRVEPGQNLCIVFGRTPSDGAVGVAWYAQGYKVDYP